MQVHWGKKEVYRVHQNDQKSLSWEIRGQKVPKSSFNQEMKDQKKKKKKERKKEKEKKPARLKTQKGGLDKS